MRYKTWTLAEIVEQLADCDYRNEAGALTHNVAFIALRKLAYDPKQRSRELGYQIGTLIIWTGALGILMIIVAVFIRLALWLALGG